MLAGLQRALHEDDLIAQHPDELVRKDIGIVHALSRHDLIVLIDVALTGEDLILDAVADAARGALTLILTELLGEVLPHRLVLGLELLVIRTDASEVGTIRVLLLLALITDDGSSIALDVPVATLLIDVAEHTPQLGQRQAPTSGSRPLAELPQLQQRELNECSIGEHPDLLQLSTKAVATQLIAGKASAHRTARRPLLVRREGLPDREVRGIGSIV